MHNTWLPQGLMGAPAPHNPEQEEVGKNIRMDLI